MPHVLNRRFEPSRGGPGTPNATTNVMMTVLFACALFGLFAVNWLWVAR